MEKLRLRGHISHHLTSVKISKTTHHDDCLSGITFDRSKNEVYHGSKSYMGVFSSPKLIGKMRRIDIKFYPYRERAFASIYFTGNGFFNRSMRLYASRIKKMTLNDHGLFLQNRSDKTITCADSLNYVSKSIIAQNEVKLSDLVPGPLILITFELLLYFYIHCSFHHLMILLLYWTHFCPFS